MPLFDCRIGSPSGEIVHETFEAVSAGSLRHRLSNEGFHIIALRRRLSLFAGRQQPKRGRISNSQFLAFNQELVVLLRSGLPMLQVLDAILERLDEGALRRAVQQIRAAVKGGARLSEAFGHFPELFPHLYIASLQAGEQTGDLPVTLQRYIDYQKRVEQIKGKVKMAAIYPCLLCLAALVVLLFMVFYVIPKFADIYADAHVDLPWVTRLLIAGSDVLTNHLLLLLPLPLLLPLLLRRTGMRQRFGATIDRWKLRIAFLGPLCLEYALLNFTRTLATLLAGGIPMVSAMKMSRKTLNNRYLEDRLAGAIEKISEGQSPTAALEQTGFFPSLALRMITAGERSGALQDMLFEIAGYYESRVEERLECFSSMIEPLMMLIIGLVIGSIVVAMYIPIFQLAGAA
jgi:type IV pilus assembly protein PilC